MRLTVELGHTGHAEFLLCALAARIFTHLHDFLCCGAARKSAIHELRSKDERPDSQDADVAACCRDQYNAHFLTIGKSGEPAMLGFSRNPSEAAFQFTGNVEGILTIAEFRYDPEYFLRAGAEPTL